VGERSFCAARIFLEACKMVEEVNPLVFTKLSPAIVALWSPLSWLYVALDVTRAREQDLAAHPDHIIEPLEKADIYRMVRLARTYKGEFYSNKSYLELMVVF